MGGVSEWSPKISSALAPSPRRANPHPQVVTHRTRLTADNCRQIISLYDLVVDGSDNFTTRYLVNDACFLPHRQYVWGPSSSSRGRVRSLRPRPRSWKVTSTYP
jgi:molybdopterin/thiamine biosynthesis adenylyltransferase